MGPVLSSKKEMAEFKRICQERRELKMLYHKGIADSHRAEVAQLKARIAELEGLAIEPEVPASPELLTVVCADGHRP